MVPGLSEDGKEPGVLGQSGVCVCVCHTLVLRVSTFSPFHYHRDRSFSIDVNSSQAGGQGLQR